MSSFISNYLSSPLKCKITEKANFLEREERLLKLLDDCFKSDADPELQERCKKDIIAIERYHGSEMHFVIPAPGYTMKVLADAGKYFINICTADCVDMATSKTSDGELIWDIPVRVTKVIDCKDNSQRRCNLVDALIHPETMKIADDNRRFKKLVECKVMSIMKEKFNADFTKVEWKYPKMKHKGMLPTMVILKTEDGSKYIGTMQEYYDVVVKNVELASSS